MQNLDGDLKRALLDTLCESWKVRKATIDRIFTEDAQFWHLFHNVRGIKNIHGIYQLWGSTNYPPLAIDFIRVVADEKNNVAMVDLVEYCNLWAMPPWTFFGGPTMRLHVILGFVDTPAGKKIVYQVRHAVSSPAWHPAMLHAASWGLEAPLPAVWHVPQGLGAHPQH